VLAGSYTLKRIVRSKFFFSPNLVSFTGYREGSSHVHVDLVLSEVLRLHTFTILEELSSDAIIYLVPRATRIGS